MKSAGFADPDCDIIHAPTPHDMIERLIPTLKSDCSIAAYVKFAMGAVVSLDVIVQQRREHRRRAARADNALLDGGAIGITSMDEHREKSAAKASRMLANRINAKHPKIYR